MTCDEGRPCQRCIKKGIEGTCHDGVRKQAKYLLDTPQEYKVTKTDVHTNRPTINPAAAIQVPQFSNTLPLTPPDKNNVNQPSSSNFTSKFAVLNNPPLQQSTQEQQQQQQHPPPQTSTGSGNYDFGSKAANLEYSILSNMLRMDSNQYAPDGSILPGTTSLTPPESDSPNSNTNLNFDFNNLQQSMTNAANTDTTYPAESQDKHPEEVYRSVTAPFPYTQGYHSLIAYLRSRFDKRHLLHMAQAMAAYRPSFIATTKTLKEEDLIFMEKCFQRTLLEFEKFIAFSGTPTVVWRRTGQIAAVGKEFCILTDWPKERLLNQSTFIVELMDDKSVTDYFDVFSKLAFGDSRGVTMTECTLLKPSGDKVPTACTWTVKRDVFDIPMMIIGNFLPILS